MKPIIISTALLMQALALPTDPTPGQTFDLCYTKATPNLAPEDVKDIYKFICLVGRVDQQAHSCEIYIQQSPENYTNEGDEGDDDEEFHSLKVSACPSDNESVRELVYKLLEEKKLEQELEQEQQEAAAEEAVPEGEGEGEESDGEDTDEGEEFELVVPRFEVEERKIIIDWCSLH